MTQHQERARRAQQPRRFDIFAADLDTETIRGFAAAWAAKARRKPTEREIDIFWNLIDAIPPDDDDVRRVPKEVIHLIRKWRRWLEGRPGWGYREVEG